MTTYGKNGPVIIEEGSEVQNIIARQDFSLFLPTFRLRHLSGL
jgi:hypothetical protein